MPTQSGCIDQVRLNFSPALVPATIGYDVSGVTTTSSASGGVQLVIKLGGAAVEGGGSAPPQQAAQVTWGGPPTVAPRSLTHVSQIAVQQGANGEIDVVLSVDGRDPFTASTSAAPPYLVVSVASTS